jgi:hypothetical protein
VVVFVYLVDRRTHLRHLVGVEYVAEVAKRPSPDESLDRLADRLALPLARSETLVHVLVKPNLV